MKVYANKDDFEWFKEMHSEGKTRPMTITTFKESLDDIEISLSRPSKTSPKIEGQLQHGVNTGELKTCEDCDSIKGSPQKKNAPWKGYDGLDNFCHSLGRPDYEGENEIRMHWKELSEKLHEYLTSHSHSSCGAKVSSNAATEDEYHSDKESPLVNVGAATVFGGTSVPPTHERSTLVESVAAETPCDVECLFRKGLNKFHENETITNCGCICHKEKGVR